MFPIASNDKDDSLLQIIIKFLFVVMTRVSSLLNLLWLFRLLSGVKVLLFMDPADGTVNLGLENTDIQLTDQGAIKVDPHLHTTVPNVLAIGDVKGGPQFTYISLDDFRIIKDELFGDGTRQTTNRGVVPTSVFIEPPLSQVGLTEKQAQAAGKASMIY